jgi:hypothetical protein
MASTYSAQKGYLEKPAHGDYTDTWEIPVNANMDAIDKALGGTIEKNLSTGDVVLERAEAQYLVLRLTGSSSNARNVTLPATVGGFWIVKNEFSGAAATIKGSGPNTVTVSGAGTTLIYSDGTNVYLGDNSYYMAKSGGEFTGGITLPSNGLAVGGSQLVVAGGNVTTSGNITAQGNVTAYSDRRLKNNIRAIENALDLVNAMEGVRYDDLLGRERIGLIAQEVREVVPEVVFADHKGLLSVAYQNLVAVLIEAVKELSARVDELEAHE